MNDKSGRVIRIIARKLSVRIRSGWRWIRNHDDSLGIILTAGGVIATGYLLIETQKEPDVSWTTSSVQRGQDVPGDSFQRIRDSVNKAFFYSPPALKKRNADSALALCKRIAVNQERSAKTDVRAYLIAEPDTTHWIERLSDTVARATWLIGNVGKTPAHHVRIGFYHYWIELPVAEQMRIVIPYIGQTIESGRIQAKWETFNGSKAAIDQLAAREVPVYIAVRIAYEDVFDKPHSTYRHIRSEKDGIHSMPVPDDD